MSRKQSFIIRLVVKGGNRSRRQWVRDRDDMYVCHSRIQSCTDCIQISWGMRRGDENIMLSIMKIKNKKDSFEKSLPPSRLRHRLTSPDTTTTIWANENYNSRLVRTYSVHIILKSVYFQPSAAPAAAVLIPPSAQHQRHNFKRWCETRIFIFLSGFSSFNISSFCLIVIIYLSSHIFFILIISYTHNEPNRTPTTAWLSSSIPQHS